MSRTRLAVPTVLPVRWPLRRPFITALGQKTHTNNVLVRLPLSGGWAGMGEASSSLAMPEQTGPRMAAALRRLGRRFRGRDVRDIQHLVSEAWAAEGDWPTAVAAFESALWDALAQAEGIPFADLWGGTCRETETVLSLSAVSPQAVGVRARQAVRAGWRFLKLKLNGHEPQRLNRDRLRAVRRVAPRARILVDPNQSYDPDGLAELLAGAQSDGIEIELIEEPFCKRDWAALAKAKKRRLGPLLGDETIQNVSDAQRACRQRLLCGANIKIAKSGLARSRAILDVFDRSWKGRALFMIGCMAESPVGLSAAVQFALGMGAFHYADLDSDLILSSTGVQGGFVRRGPWLHLRPKPSAGLGIRF